VYQTASLYKKTWHVGKLKARCLVEQRCTPVELAALKKFNPTAENSQEKAKQVPDRYPSNDDSIGIELVGKVLANGMYETVTSDQNSSLGGWLRRSRRRLAFQLRRCSVTRSCHAKIPRKRRLQNGSALQGILDPVRRIGMCRS
jgi:N-acetylmuramoyl-L-alanine amidase